MFDSIYEFLCENQLSTPNQFGFRPDDSTINQLLSITHKLYSAFDEFPSRETRPIFLDISKAFDKVWHDGLLFKLISGSLFIVIKFYKQSSTACCLKWEEFYLASYNIWGASRLCGRSLAFLDIHK